MSAEHAVDSVELAEGRAVKIRNALLAAFCGCAPAAVMAYLRLPRPAMWLVGLLFGFVWANFFEYALHRAEASKPPRRMSRAARNKIAAAQRARWAKAKAQQQTQKSSA